ncbi:MAG: hypothetical protein NZT61_01355 [Deltaproteobacteria bacterium]|nr:hypothetical protein [Deltaproteobacteria bacterium]
MRTFLLVFFGFLYSDVLKLNWADSNRTRLEIWFQTEQVARECIERVKNVSLLFRYLLCTKRGLKNRCSREFVLSRDLKVSESDGKISISEDIKGDKLPGITLLYSNLSEALNDFLSPAYIQPNAEATSIQIKAEVRCVKPYASFASKFLFFLGSQFFKRKSYGWEEYQLRQR